MSWLRDKRIAVTGGGGFLGSHVVRRLEERGCRDVFVVRSAGYDLRRVDHVLRMYDDAHPDVVIHLAAKVGGIALIADWPAEFLYDNLMIGAQVMDGARRFGVEKFVSTATVCCYPEDAPVPLREEDLWAGYPEETNAPYGLAKKMLIVQAQAYRRQYGLNAVTLLPANLYGPGADFDPETSHVIPALIRKCLDAVNGGDDCIEVWGSGEASREFLYVDDAAEAVVLATERYNSAEPVNVGNGREVTIRELVQMIARLTGFRRRVAWDPSRPDGQPRRCLDTSRARREFGFTARTALEHGLHRTLQWYLYERARAPIDPNKETVS
ncbi:MAG: GDP-L-fucose synthase [Dehalococcoidia bacterium]